MKKIRAFFENNRAVFACFLGALLLDITIELMYRRSLPAFWDFVSVRPLAFLENVLLLTTTLSLCLFFRRKWFYAVLAGSVWAALGVTNMLLLNYRISPLSAIDFSILQLDWSFIHIYASVATIVMVIFAIVLLLTGLVLLFFKSPKSAVHPLRSVITLCALLFAVFILPEMPLHSGFAGNVYKDIINLTEQYGFVYTFSRSVVDRGIDCPEDYSARRVHAIAEEIFRAEENDCTDAPNVVVVQMESFFDINHLKDVVFSEDPVPYFRELKEKGMSGFFTAPSVGAGTANTEFEVLTQMDVHMFGTGEYPYKTILQEETCESLAYILKDCGLAAHAIHNNTATFYDRHLAYPNLGFDSFTSLEYMQDVVYTEQGWAEDSVLVGEIEKALRSTAERDLVFTISVQPHGPYPEEDSGNAFEILSGVEDPEMKNQLEYYAGQLRAVDDMLRALTAKLRALGEPTVLVVYGDHMPAMEFEESMLDAGNAYTTEYAVWANFPIPEEDRDVKAYQMMSHVLKTLDMNCGTLTKFHQLNDWSGAYETELLTLQYDMLYGDQISYYGEDPFEPTKMRFGTEDVVLGKASILWKTLVVTGENFTPYSVICINGEEQETKFVSETELRCAVDDLPETPKVSVCQMAEDGTVLSLAVLKRE